jgi:hypothetical protein
MIKLKEDSFLNFESTRLPSLTYEGLCCPLRIGDLKQSEALPDRSTIYDVRQQATIPEVARGAGAIVNLAAEQPG